MAILLVLNQEYYHLLDHHGGKNGGGGIYNSQYYIHFVRSSFKESRILVELLNQLLFILLIDKNFRVISILFSLVVGVFLIFL